MSYIHDLTGLEDHQLDSIIEGAKSGEAGAKALLRDYLVSAADHPSISIHLFRVLREMKE